AHLKAGSIRDLKPGEDERPGIILGSKLAEQIGAMVGKPVQLIIPNGQATPMGMRPGYKSANVAGIFETGTSDIDSRWRYMSLAAMQKVYGYSDIVNGIELRLDDIHEAQSVAKAAEAMVGPKLAATTWEDQSRQILQALNLERLGTILIIG